MPSYIISSVYACIKLNVRNIPQYLCKHLHFPRNKNKQIDTCFYMAHVCVCNVMICDAGEAPGGGVNKQLAT